ncbi:MAG: DNA gyrase inhibitor YacG [Acidobacteriota bacterium]
MTKILKCPICRKEVPLTSSNVPFCSDRCRTIDLGKWASGDYKISSPILDPDLLEELEEAQQQSNSTKEWKN